MKAQPKYRVSCEWCGKRSRPVSSWTITNWVNSHDKVCEAQSDSESASIVEDAARAGLRAYIRLTTFPGPAHEVSA